MSRIVFCGNFHVDFSSESQHAKSLEKLGHTVIRMQEAETPGEVILDWAKTADLYVHVHTHGWETPGLPLSEVLSELRRINIPTATYHLDLWKGLRREQDLHEDAFYRNIGHFFTVDRLMADWFNENTEVKGHYLRAGVFEDECVQLPQTGHFADVAFVGSKGYHPEWPWRHQLIDGLREMYGDRFRHIGPDGDTGVVRGMHLNQMLANTKVVVGDSLCLNFDYPDYWSDRVYEIIGRGGFLVMPHIVGLETEFNHAHELPVFSFGNFDSIRKIVDFYVENDEARHTVRNNAFRRVRENYTYTHRWQSILSELGL